MQNVLSGAISVVQCLSSRCTVWKSSSSSEYSGGRSGSWSSSELSEVNDKWWRTGLGGVNGLLWFAVAVVLRGIVCARLKDACSMLDMWCMQGVFCKGVGRSAVLEPLLQPSSANDNYWVNAAFSAITKHPNKTSSGS